MPANNITLEEAADFFVSGDSFESEPDTVNPSSRRISARPLILIPPIPIK